VDTGCQNIIEPAALGLPVLTGPSLYNFQAVSELLKDAGGMLVVQDETELAQQVVLLCQQAESAKSMGAKALNVVAQNQGAAEHLYQLLIQRLPN
jgi:3-deoxy-D-manno-octulosonic-acid transferase